jgi:hypothetical protein
MAGKYSDLQGGFAAALQEFRDKALQASDSAFQGIMLKVASEIMTKSPVGDPDRWKVNAVATQYNGAVAAANTALRNSAENLKKNGHLKAGLKINDGMDISRPEGYVGGHFRANWQFQVGSSPSGEIEGVDPSGNKTMVAAQAGIQTLKIGDTAYFVNNLPYAVPLEYGHSTQAPSGMVRTTAAQFLQIVDESVKANKV